MRGMFVYVSVGCSCFVDKDWGINGRVGFVKRGVSESKHGGVVWYDCIYTIPRGRGES